MKFIGEIYNTELISKTLNVKLEKYHRTATGSLTDSKVFLFPRILEITNSSGKNVLVKEIIISQFPPHSWNHIWRIKLIVNDRPGATERITEILKNLNININTQESLMTHYETNFNISLIADFSLIKSNGEFINNLHTNKKELEKAYKKFLEKAYKKEFGKDLIHTSLKPVYFLHLNSRLDTTNNKIEESRLNTYYNYNYNSITVINGKIKINSTILKDLNIFEQYNSHTISYTINSDTEEKYSILRFFRPNQSVIYFDVAHINEKGAINQFSKIITQTNKRYNIINSYNRIEDFKTKAHWYVMIDCSEIPDDWEILFDKINKIDTVSSIKIINYTKTLSRLSSNELPEPTKKINDRNKVIYDLKTELNNIKNENNNYIKDLNFIKTNYRNIFRFSIVMASLFFMQLLVVLYYTIINSLNIEKIKDITQFLSALASIFGIPSALYFMYQQYKSYNSKNKYN